VTKTGEAGSNWLPLFPPRTNRGTDLRIILNGSLVRTRKINFVCFLVGSKNVQREAEISNKDLVILISLEGSKWRDFREIIREILFTGIEKVRNWRT